MSSQEDTLKKEVEQKNLSAFYSSSLTYERNLEIQVEISKHLKHKINLLRTYDLTGSILCQDHQRFMHSEEEA